MTTQRSYGTNVVALSIFNRCEYSGTPGHRCPLPATWMVDVHGCENRLMCTGHRDGWERMVRHVLSVGGRTTCTMCGLTFISLESVVQVAAL